jgi:glyoxylase-like metal-dependent hydrolase (beta-lactamase superfamily II)
VKPNEKRHSIKGQTMTIRRLFSVLAFGFGIIGASPVLPYPEIPVQVTRISDRILVLNASTMENNVIAIASERGLVVVDSTGVPSTARRLREIIREEFGRDDFAYLINTHYHWDHSWGNMAFPEAKTVGHELCIRRMREDEGRMDQTVASFQRNQEESRKRLRDLDPSSDEAERTRIFLEEVERSLLDYTEGFRMLPPQISFNDSLVLDMGDLTLNMVYFGRSHSGADIFIHIPEEGLLLTGDIFLDGRWLPLFSTAGPLDIPRWIEVLDRFLADDNIRQVIPGHQHFWPRARLELWRDYIRDLWQGVRSAKQEGLRLDQVLERFPLGREYFYLKDLNHTDQELERFQERNVRAFWGQLLEPADAVLERAFDEGGLEAGRAKKIAIKRDRDREYSVEERSLNALGYRLLQQGRSAEAIEVFELNVELFPQSWNVHDSLGEAYWRLERIQEAYDCYQRSMELESQNPRRDEILGTLSGTLFDLNHETAETPQFPPGDSTGISGPYLGQEPPGLEPKIFAPGIVSTAGNMEFSCTFSPDGKEFYFTRRKPGEGNQILVSRWTESGWSMPEPASFSGEFGGHEPHIRPDGRKLYFGSSRPIEKGGEPTYGIWEMDRTPEGWGEPRYLTLGMFATLAQDHDLYITTLEGPPGLGRMPWESGRYGPIEMLGDAVNSPVPGVHPCISPDERFLIFDANRPGGQGGEGDLYVTFLNPDGSWSEPRNLGDGINSPGTDFCAALSPDGKYLFYHSKRDIYWVSTRVLDSLK